LRGQWSRSWPKKSLKISFPDGKLFQGQRTLNLNSAWRDPAFVREPLAYHVYAICGVPVPRSRMVRLNVNGQFHGLYVEVEQPNQEFLKRMGLKGGTLIKAISDSVRPNQSDERDLGSESIFGQHYEAHTHKTNALRQLKQFCHELACTPDAQAFFSNHVDVDRYINYLAATVLTQNWDCYNKNHYLVYDGEGSQKWLVVPWDLDRTFGDHWNQTFDESRFPILQGTSAEPGITGWNRLADRLLSDPVLRSRFLARLKELVEKEFTTEKLFPLLDQFEAAIAPDAAQDRHRWPNFSSGDVSRGIAGVKQYVEQRRAFLLSGLEKLKSAEP